MTKHVVFSTKKVARQKEAAARAAREQQAAPTATAPAATTTTPPPPSSSSTTTTTTTTTTPTVETTTAAPRQQLVVEIEDDAASPALSSMRRQSSTGSGSGSGRSSHRSHSHRSSAKKITRLGERTVKRLHPAPALLQSDRVTVAQCVKTMVEKKADATLLVDRNGLLTGILTDRDIACKVVALGRNPRTTRVADVMTPNPHCVASNASAIDALKKMVSGQFRHLPVADNDKVVGILDIAKCLYEAITKIEQEYNAHSKSLEDAVKKLQQHLRSSAQENLFEKLREKLFLPTLSAILVDRSPVPVLHSSSTALDAAILMLSKNTSAVMVCNDEEEMVGIFTSKDLMRRVVAMEISPVDCSLSKVMTTNPFSARLNTTILETLHTMHNGKFLHVPVFDDEGKLAGLVDVLQATCAIVQQMGTLQFSKSDNVQPLWNQLRQSLIPNEESTEGEDVDEDEHRPNDDDDNDRSELEQSGSEISSSERHLGWSHGRDETNPENDPIHADPTSPEEASETDRRPDVFVFKLADWNGANHRFTSSAESLKELIKDVQNRLGDYTIRKVHYIDDDGDHVLLFTDADLKDAVKRARMWGNKYIRLIVLHRVSRQGMRSVARVAHQHDNVLGMVYYAAAAAAIAGASFFLSRRR